MLKIENLSMKYGDKLALENINMTINKNEITAFIGPSGCGKSTLLRCFNRMNDLINDTTIEGSITYNDNNIYSKQQSVLDLRKKIGMVFQTANPFPMSIYDNVAYGPIKQGLRNKKELDLIVESSLKQAALWDEVKDRLKDSAIKLSGGQQQRLCIARTLAIKPEVILMDEPTSALDPASTQKIEDLLIDLKKDYTIIIVTHNMQQALRVSDNTAFFYLGKLIEYDKTQNLFSNPKLKQTEEYITGRFG